MSLYHDIKTNKINISDILFINDSTQSSSIIDYNTTSRGITIPQLTKIEKNNINNPIDGLMVYDKDFQSESIFIYSDNKWSIGLRQLKNNTIIGNENTLPTISTNTFNVILGNNNSTYLDGNNNTIIGNNCVNNINCNMENNICIGTGSNTLQESSNNIIVIGNNSNNTSSILNDCIIIGNNIECMNNLENQIVLGNSATSTKSNQIVLGNNLIEEVVPSVSSNTNLGTNTSPWNNISSKGNIDLINNGKYKINNINLNLSHLEDCNITLPNNEQSIIYDGSIWKNITIFKRLDLYDLAGFQDIPLTYSNYIYDTINIIDNNFTYNNTNGEITVLTTDYYKINYVSLLTSDKPDERWTIKIQLFYNNVWNDVPGSILVGVSNKSGFCTTVSGCVLCLINANYKLRVSIRSENDIMSSLPESNRITITKS